MPELPEVETLRQQLFSCLPQKIIRNVHIFDLKVVHPYSEPLECLRNKQVVDIQRRGKMLLISFFGDEDILLIHLRMTGQLLYQDSQIQRGGGHSLTVTTPSRNTRCRFTISFTDGSSMSFFDQRRLGHVGVFKPEVFTRITQHFGIEPLSPSFSIDRLHDCIGNKKTSLKAFLLNQKYIAGIGNIYADEICFRAGVLPTRNVSSLSFEEIPKVYASIVSILTEAVSKGGTSFHTFIHPNGIQGRYYDRLQVYQKQGQQCLRCQKGVIKKFRHGQRGTHACFECQK